jgi:hypothetical protein
MGLTLRRNLDRKLTIDEFDGNFEYLEGLLSDVDGGDSSGTSGTSGSSGTSGESGTSGTSGENGTSGTSGENGTSGTSGESGTSGTSGESGTSGTSGESGTSGTSGESGTSGTSGENGTSGTSGENGTSGTSGESGTSGTSGESGTSGTSGENGTSGTSGTSAVNNYLEYIGMVRFNGTNAYPVVTVFKNTLGGTPIWDKFDDGVYSISLIGAFPYDKTWILGNTDIISLQSSFKSLLKFYRSDDDTIFIYNVDLTQLDEGPHAIVSNYYMAFEIRVYP